MDTPYRVGDLEVSIRAISADAVTSLDAVISRMSSLSSVLKTVTTADLKWITSFGTRMKTLTKNISEINWDFINWGKVERGFQGLSKALDPFLVRVERAGDGLTALYGIIKRVNKVGGLIRWDKASGSTNGGHKGRSLFSTFGKLLPTVYMARRLANITADLVQYGSDYTETLNLWQVAMRDNLSLATEFVDKMNKAYGISQKTLMQAQATFRNMIGSLGDLSDTTSYELSEAITQMAIDYSSLYNTSIEEAVNKFQSALAGQARPIRSISGYDITEKTIQALYESIGGTKTQRQLSRTEKQLLAIYAVFNQMEKSGALGDMSKTLENFANQSRMMVENWRELATWVGTIVTYTLQESGLMIKINAMLMTMSNIAKAVAHSLGYETPDFASGWEDNVDGTIDAVDELQGKLLGFDKIRALQQSGEEISIDERLLNALSGYSSILENVNNEATSLAEKWTAFWVDPETGELTEHAKTILAILKGIGAILTVILAKKIGTLILKGTRYLFDLKNALDLVRLALVTGIIASIVRAIELFKEGKTLAGLLAVAIGVTLVSALVLLKLRSLDATKALFGIDKWLATTGKTALKASIGIASFTAGILAIMTADMGWGQKIISLFVGIATAVSAAAVAIKVFGMDWAGALSVAGLVGGTALAVSAMVGNASVKKFAKGGTPDKGTLFIAGEAGAEIVSTSPSGKTGVSNVQQIQQAFYGALQQWSASYLSSEFDKTRMSNSKSVAISSGAVFESVKAEASRRGYGFSKK